MFIYFILPVIAIAASVLIAYKTAKSHGAKRGFLVHFVSLAIIFSLCFAMATMVSAAGENDADTTAAQSQAADEEEATGTANGLGLIAAALAIGLSGIGGGLAVAAGAPAAIGATAENPEVFGKAIIFVALGEAIALYGFVISFLIINKV